MVHQIETQVHNLTNTSLSYHKANAWGQKKKKDFLSRFKLLFLFHFTSTKHKQVYVSLVINLLTCLCIFTWILLFFNPRNEVKSQNILYDLKKIKLDILFCLIPHYAASSYFLYKVFFFNNLSINSRPPNIFKFFFSFIFRKRKKQAYILTWWKAIG